jgi:vesicle-fusing ATPase
LFRFEVQLEIGLPKEAGRAQIFQIHTHSMRQYGLLSDDIDIGELARLTPQYSGAEIAGIVRFARLVLFHSSFACVFSLHFHRNFTLRAEM